jgi:flagellar biosynthesis protein FlhB
MAEKTEAPTPRRREQARAKGQGVGRSWEFSMGLTLGVGTLALASLIPGMAATLVTRTQSAIVDMSPGASSSQLASETGDAIQTVLILVLPLAFLVLIAGVAGNLVSGGLVFSYKAIRFDLNRINPMTGLKRIVDRQALVRLGLATAKLSILALISWQVVGSRVPSIVSTEGSSATAIAGSCLSAVFQLGLTITILLAVVALVDFVVQRRRAMESIRMTKEEVRQEYKESEGDPLIRGARRRRARQMAFARMMDAVPTADVVITNPTTLAVALKYDSLTMRAPKIVAKGQRLMADRIKELARQHNVPVIEDKPLARALFSRPVGTEVPAHLYRAVARLLVLVHQARFGAGRRGAGGRRGARGWSAESARNVAGGLASRPWWNAATAPLGGVVLDAGTGGAGGSFDSSAAARLYGDASGAGDDEMDAAAGPTADVEPGAARDGAAGSDASEAGAGDPGDAVDDAWLDDAGLNPADVDEDALAVAMAEDELGDITPDEMAQLEAGLVLGEVSTGLDGEERER